MSITSSTSNTSTSLWQSLRRRWPKRMPSPSQAVDRTALDFTARSLQYFLDLSTEAAATTAQKILQNEQQWQTKDKPANAGLPEFLSALEDVAGAVLALPAQLDALHLLKHLQQSGRAFLIIESPALKALLQTTKLLDVLPKLATTKQVIAACKLAAQSGQAIDRAPLIISFPELHPYVAGAMTTQNFAKQACEFSVLDSYLAHTYGLPLFCLTLQADTGLQMARWQMQCFAGQEENATAKIAAASKWLFTLLQVSAQQQVERCFSWQYLYRAGQHFRQIDRHDKIRQLEAYFDAWKRFGHGLDEAQYQQCKEQFAQMRGG